MVFNRQIFRKVIWAPTALASVSLTLYLSNLWLAQNNRETMLNSIIPEIQDEKQQQESSPDKAAPDGKDEETKEASKAEKKEQPKKDEEQVPPQKPTPGKGKSSENSESNQAPQADNGNMDLERYIIAKIRDMNQNGKTWHDHYKDGFLESWKLTTTVESLIEAIERFMRDQPRLEESSTGVD